MPTIVNIVTIIINLGIIIFWIFYWINFYKKNKLEKIRENERQKRHDKEMENHIKIAGYWDNFLNNIPESEDKKDKEQNKE